MRAWLQVGLLAVLGAALAASGFGQSVAEAARQEQARKSSARPAQRVYTNEDFPARLPESAPAPAASAEDKEKEPAAAQQSRKLSADEIRSAVLAQKRKVRVLDGRLAELQRQLDEWNNANVWTWCPNNPYYYNPYEDWCETPQRLQLEVNKVKGERDEAQGALEQMQEEARRMGYRSVVYDPD